MVMRAMGWGAFAGAVAGAIYGLAVVASLYSVLAGGTAVLGAIYGTPLGLAVGLVDGIVISTSVEDGHLPRSRVRIVRWVVLAVPIVMAGMATLLPDFVDGFSEAMYSLLLPGLIAGLASWALLPRFVARYLDPA
jgi:hypothetical protein